MRYESCWKDRARAQSLKKLVQRNSFLGSSVDKDKQNIEFFFSLNRTEMIHFQNRAVDTNRLFNTQKDASRSFLFLLSVIDRLKEILGIDISSRSMEGNQGHSTSDIIIGSSRSNRKTLSRVTNCSLSCLSEIFCANRATNILKGSFSRSFFPLHRMITSTLICYCLLNMVNVISTLAKFGNFFIVSNCRWIGGHK